MPFSFATFAIASFSIRNTWQSVIATDEYVKVFPENTDERPTNSPGLIILRLKFLVPSPAELNAAWDANGVTLTWAAPPQTDIKCYKIWRKKIFGAEELATVTETKGGLTAAQAGKGLTVLVSAVDADGLESPRSAPLELVVPAHSGEPK